MGQESSQEQAVPRRAPRQEMEPSQEAAAVSSSPDVLDLMSVISSQMMITSWCHLMAGIPVAGQARITPKWMKERLARKQ